MRITSAHRDAYLLHHLGLSAPDIAEQLLLVYGNFYTSGQIDRMVGEMSLVIELQQAGGGVGAEADSV